MYQVILADPPWSYSNNKTGGERCKQNGEKGGARKHYQLMKDPELLAMRPYIDSISDKNCALFLWVTMPRLDFGIELLKGWGFRYVTNAFTWVKTVGDESAFIYGPGYYTASNTEIVLLGVKGKMKPERRMVPSIIMTPRMEHSRKPEEVHRRIEEMYPQDKFRHIELFARRSYAGWDAMGNELEVV